MSLLDNAYALISTQGRSIGTIIPDVVVEEHHLDELMITDHPVETGATISDHAFKKPSEVDMKIGFSNSTAGTEGWVQAAYEMLLALQAKREPFDVTTGKRSYKNMLIRSISVVTDPQSEFALNAVISLREVIIVSTQQSGGGGANGIGATADQANPASTQPTQDAGTAQLGVVDGVPTFAQTSAVPTGDTTGTPFGSTDTPVVLDDVYVDTSQPTFAPFDAMGNSQGVGG